MPQRLTMPAGLQGSGGPGQPDGQGDGSVQEVDDFLQVRRCRWSCVGDGVHVALSTAASFTLSTSACEMHAD